MTIIPDTNEARSHSILTSLIPTGKANAMPMRFLAKLMETETYSVREEVLKARTDGILICSCQNGYYFPEDLGELQDYYQRRRGYIRTAQAAFSPFQNAVACRR